MKNFNSIFKNHVSGEKYIDFYPARWYVFPGNQMKWITVTINGRELNVGFDDNSIHVYNAFPIKDDLKLRGYRWDPGDKSWFITTEKIKEELSVLKNNLRSVTPPASPGKSTDLSKFPFSFSVVELRNRIDRLIKEGIGGNVWIRGVIASEVKQYEWASYLDLKDEDDQSDVFFRVEVMKKNLDAINKKLSELGVADSLERDLPIFCLVEVHLSLRNVVDIRLTIRDILPEYTQSRIRSQRDITIEKLEAEKVLENQKKLKLGLWISRIGLITSEKGTSVLDVLAGLGDYKDRYYFYFLDTRMEGANAVESIIHSMDILEHEGKIPLDAIILTRGGGSEQSLAVFNDYRLCYRVCMSKIPVLTAIGHEKDLSAVEICSHFTPTPSTPSGMGKYLQDRFLNLRSELGEMVGQLIQFAQLIRNRESEKLTACLNLIPSQVIRFLKFHNEQFFSRIWQFEQSASFLVKNQEREVKNRLLSIEKKKGLIYRTLDQGMKRVMTWMLERLMVLNQREKKQIAKIISRLDFKKLLRENRRAHTEALNQLRMAIDRGKRYLTSGENNLVSRKNLVIAREPDRILKKGFTLTLDNEKRVIPTLKRFKTVREARLKFSDGISTITRKEDK